MANEKTNVDEKPQGPELVIVKFLVGQPPYNAGETAGFPAEVAERFLQARTKSGQRIAERSNKPVYLKSAIETPQS